MSQATTVKGTSSPAPVAERRVSRGLWSDAFRRLVRNKPAMVGLVCIVIFVGAAVFAPVIAPYGPLEQRLLELLDEHPARPDLAERAPPVAIAAGGDGDERHLDPLAPQPVGRVRRLGHRQARPPGAHPQHGHDGRFSSSSPNRWARASA